MIQGIDITATTRERAIEQLSERAETEGLERVLLSIGQRGNIDLREAIKERLGWTS